MIHAISTAVKDNRTGVDLESGLSTSWFEMWWAGPLYFSNSSFVNLRATSLSIMSCICCWQVSACFLFLESRFSVDINMPNAVLLLSGRSKGSLIQGYSAAQNFLLRHGLDFSQLRLIPFLPWLYRTCAGVATERASTALASTAARTSRESEILHVVEVFDLAILTWWAYIAPMRDFSLIPLRTGGVPLMHRPNLFLNERCSELCSFKGFKSAYS